METREEIIDTTTDDGDMAVLVTEPVDEGPWPVVLMFIDAPGIRPATHAFASKLAGEGYRVVVPDLHHRHGRLLNAGETTPPEGMTTQEMVWSWIGSMTDAQIQHDADRGLAAAGVDPATPVATVGFCLGARAVFRRMMDEPERVVAGAMWHPSFLADDGTDSPHLTAGDIRAPLYIGIGTADQVQSIAMHQPFFDVVEALPSVELVIFDGADHGYTWPGQPNYHQDASETSFAKTTELFAAAFG